MKNSRRPHVSLKDRYLACYKEYLDPFAKILQTHLVEIMDGIEHVDRISVRAKDPKSFLKKADKTEGGKPKYSNPMRQIQDQVGARIVVFYKADVLKINHIVDSYFTPIELADRVPESQWQFGYFGRHYSLKIPADLRILDTQPDMPSFFELQIKTLFQHAWSEAEHDLAYKPDVKKLTDDQERRLAFTSAQAWGADRVFDELSEELTTLSISEEPSNNH